MLALSKVQGHDVIAVDIETVPQVATYSELTEQGREAWAAKMADKGVIPPAHELARRWKESAGTYAEFNKIIAVAFAWITEQDATIKSTVIKNHDEIALLWELSGMLDNMLAKNARVRLVGHASKWFDYPVMAKRFIINGIAVPVILDTSALKPWEHMNLDTNELWRSYGTGVGSSLVALCYALGIESPKQGISGGDVARVYYDYDGKQDGSIDNRLATIADYCRRDTIATYQIFQRFKTL